MPIASLSGFALISCGGEFRPALKGLFGLLDSGVQFLLKNFSGWQRGHVFGHSDAAVFQIYKDRDRALRSTVSLDHCVWQLLALKLGIDPDSEQSHGAVRQWLQQMAVLEIADKNLSTKYWDWQVEVNLRDEKFT